MLTLLYARAGQDSRRALLERMGRSEAPRRVLIVPEQYSHESERALCRLLGNTACARCEVLSFTRLAGRLADLLGGGAAPMLDAGGRMLLLYSALRQVGDALRLYKAPSRKPAFLTGLLATIDECRSYQVGPDVLMEAGEALGGRQGDKWRDIGLIYAAYDALCASSAADPRTRLDRLADQLGRCDWAEDKEIYIHGFTDFTPQEGTVIAALAACCPVTAALNAGDGDDPAGIFEPARRAARRLKAAMVRQGTDWREETLAGYGRAEPSLAFLERNLFGPLPEPWASPCAVTRVRAADPRREVEWAAAEILKLLRGGLRCRDIAVCARRMGGYGELIDSVFARCGIPVFRAAVDDVLQKPVMALVTAALAAAAEDYPYEELFRYFKTDLTGLTRQERDELENYVLTWDLHGSAWTRERPWDMHPEGYGQTFTEEQRAQVAALDALRRRAIAPLEELRRDPDHTGRGRALALYRLMEGIGLPARLAQRAAALEGRGDLNTAAQYRQLWGIISGALEQCALLLGDTELELDEFSRLFSLALSQYDVGAIPVSLDRVTVGEAPRLAHKEVKVLFFLGADSRAVPDCSPAPGLFSDQDRDLLAEQEVELAPRQEDKLRREFTIAYETCAIPTQRLYLSYAAADGVGEERLPCLLWERLELLFPNAAPVTAGESRLAAPASALELAGESPRLAAALRAVSGYGERVDRVEQAARWRRGSLSPAGVRALYGPVVGMSATRLDLLNSCHFGYFMRYGLDAKPRRQAAFRPTEYGTFVHAVLEGVLGRAAAVGGVKALAADDGLRRAMAAQEAERYEREVLSGLEGETARLRYLFDRMKGAALAVVDSVVAELAASDFTPARFELGFGRGQELPPVEAENGVRLSLTGFVDRLDQWEHEGRRYLRVVDYKTGKKSFDFSDVEDGRGLQMLLYLFALKKYGAAALGPGEIVPAGVLYVPARTPLLDGDRTMTDAQVAAGRDRLLRRQGLVLDDPAVLSAMEHTDGPYRFLPVAEGRGRGDYLVSAEQMEALDEYITDALTAAAGELAKGNIAADPYWHDGNRNACRWCEYRAACHFESACGDVKRRRKGVSSGEFWAWMARRKEGEDHGL